MAGEGPIFQDRRDAGARLAALFEGRALTRPLVLGIPRGGVVVGSVLARALGGELDVVLSRKLRAREQPELAIGALGEDGAVYLNPGARYEAEHLEGERRAQQEEIARRAAMVRAVRPAAPVEGRTVIVTDDGLATGSTMIAALHTLRARAPRELIAAVPVAPPDRVGQIRELCDDVVCVATPEDFWAIGQFYERFEAVEDAEMLGCLRGGAA